MGSLMDLDIPHIPEPIVNESESECLEVFVLYKMDEYTTKRLIILRN